MILGRIVGLLWQLLPDDVGVGADLLYEDGAIYALSGNDVFFWKYTIETNSWEALAVLPLTVKAGGSLSFDDEYIFASIGNGDPSFYKYDLTANTWTAVASAPDDFSTGGATAVLVDYGCNGSCIPIPDRDPLAFDDAANVACGGASLILDVQADDIEPENEVMTTTLLPAYNAPDAQNTVTVLANDSLSITIGANFIGIDTFAYSVCDGGGHCDTALVYITIANCPPIAQDDIVSTPFETAIDVAVFSDNGNGMDSDPEGEGLVISSISNAPTNGNANIKDNGTPGDTSDDYITYTPFGGFMGMDSFDYIVCDNQNFCDTGTVFITVINGQPIAVDDPLTATNECTAIVTYPLNNDSDPEGGDILITNIITQPANGLAELKFSSQITYFPDFGFSGLDQISYEICDNGTPSQCDTAIIFLSIAGPQTNSIPIPQNDVADDIPIGQTAYIPVLTDLGNGKDIDPDGTPLTVSLPADPMLSPAGSGTLGTNGRMVTFLPNGSYVGLVTFNYQICDNPTSYGSCPAPTQECATASVSIIVTNQAPIATGDLTETGKDITQNIDVLINDLDPDGGQISLTSIGDDANATNGSTVNGGSVSLNNNGTLADPSDDFIDYIPPSGFIGVDTFSYQICDDVVAPDTECDIAKVIITITPPIDLEVNKIISTPTANLNDTVTFTIAVYNNNTDGITGNATGVSIGDRLPAGLNYVSHTVSVGAYDPVSGGWYIGDMNGGTRDTLTVKAVITDFTEAVNIAQAIAADQADKDSGYNNDDGDQSEDDEAFAFPNSLPIAVNDVDTTLYQKDSLHYVLQNDTDANGHILSITGVGTDGVDGETDNGGTVSINNNGTINTTADDYINYSPPMDFIGNDTFQYQIADGNGGVATATVTFFVRPPKETNCFDGIDEDGDLLIDCADPDCLPDKALSIIKN